MFHRMQHGGNEGAPEQQQKKLDKLQGGFKYT